MSLVLGFLYLLPVPAYALWVYSRAVPRTVHFAAVGGLYVFLAYLKVPLLLIALVPLLSLVPIFRKRNRRLALDFLEPLRSWENLLILAYASILFFTRWEPPGTDPIKWGSLARIILETNALPGDTWPLSTLRDLKGANFGIPVLLALTAKISNASLERIVFLYEIFAIVAFVFAMASALETWFDKRTSQLAALFSLLIFSQPQSYLGWGGTPTLLGALSGFFLFPLLGLLKEKSLHVFSAFVYTFGFSFTVFAHPVGVYVSTLVVLPAALWKLKEIPVKRYLLQTLGMLSLVIVVTLPYLTEATGLVSKNELAQIRDWHKEMSPFLFREKLPWIYNLYIQSTSYVWNTAAWIAVILFLVFYKRQRSLLFPWLSMIAVAVLLVDNARTWWLPLSALAYPERAGTMLVFPLSFGFALAVTYVRREKKYRVLAVFIAVVLSSLQFYARVWPHCFDSKLKPKDHPTMAEIRQKVLPEECVNVKMHTAGAWIPALAFRCTVPFHGLGMQSAEEERFQKRSAPWKYEDFLRKDG